MDALETDVPQIESYLYKTIYSRGLNYLKRYKKVNTAAIEDINETLAAFEAIREKLENGTYKQIAEANVVNMEQ